jgi:hypothetical protein
MSFARTLIDGIDHRTENKGPDPITFITFARTLRGFSDQWAALAMFGRPWPDTINLISKIALPPRARAPICAP